MIPFFTKPSEARVHVVEPLVALRSVIVEALRNQGFSQVTAFGDLKTMLDHLVHESSDWILSASCINNDINIMHFIKLCIDEPRFRHIRVSLLMREHEKDLLPLAFEYGLLSFHCTTIPSRIPEEIAELIRVLRQVGYSGALTAANYLRRILRENRQWDTIIHLERTLLEIFPGSSSILISLAEAELSSGREEGRMTLQQVLLLDPSMQEDVNQINQRFALQDSLDIPMDLNMHAGSPPATNAFGMASCMLIDPDTSVHVSVKQSLKVAGIEQVETFDSGLSAWNWLSRGGKPSLILMEWRISEVSGLQLVQRIRQQFPGIPVIIVSSLVTQAETPLLKEIGVSGIVEKPFDTQSLMTEIINTVQQNRYPTEQSAMDRRILYCLNLNSREEACRLIAMYLSNPVYDEVGKLHIEAEFAFFEARYQQCCSLSLEALKLTGDSVQLLNLLGKALMKLGDFENALRLLEKANALAPKNVERICRMASICTDLGKMNEAENWVTEAKAVDANSILVTEAEASLAIETKDTERAADAMKKMESLHRIVAFTNNKAVASIRNNQFEKGISLYMTALNALPEPWTAVHDTICFNLALAQIRFMQYPQAQAALARIKAEPTSITGQKVSAMQSKLEHAIRTQTQLQFAAEAKVEAAPKPKAAPEFDLAVLIDAMVPMRGDICCYRSFQAKDLANEATRKLLLNMPRLSKRPPIRKEESIPHKIPKSHAS